MSLQRRHYLRNARTNRPSEPLRKRVQANDSAIWSGLEENRDAVLGLCNQRCGMPQSYIQWEARTHSIPDPVGRQSSTASLSTTPCLSEAPKPSGERKNRCKIRVLPRLINIRPALYASPRDLSITSATFFESPNERRRISYRATLCDLFLLHADIEI